MPLLLSLFFTGLFSVFAFSFSLENHELSVDFQQFEQIHPQDVSSDTTSLALCSSQNENDKEKYYFDIVETVDIEENELFSQQQLVSINSLFQFLNVTVFSALFQNLQEDKFRFFRYSFCDTSVSRQIKFQVFII
ncbi:MAG: hypothetical protein ACSHW7_07915 [Patiriisocius sp.]|uniref:hypothetical protein n=1 Tax=Patiriisocius sp. TaxID=2822396 RepID=UPI003EF19A1E